MSLPSPLSGAQRRQLRALAHDVRPVAQLGRHGMTEPFLAELDRALEEHELIKVRLRGAEREERAMMVDELGVRLRCEPVSVVGSVAVFYRPASEPERRRVDLRAAGTPGGR
jgi:RNA-binding protein